MTPHFLPLTVFLLLCASLMVFAFRPAWQEWRTPTDSDPLPIAQDLPTDMRDFATTFQAVARSRAQGELSTPNDRFEFVPGTLETMDWAAARRPLIALDSILARSAIACTTPLYIDGNLHAPQGNCLTAVFAEGAIALGAGSEVREWMHAEETIRLGPDCIALRKISSAIAVELAPGCCFEHISAPLVRFGVAPKPQPLREAEFLVESAFSDLKGAIRRSASLTMIQGDCRLPDGHRYRGSLVVTGKLSIGRHTEILGDVKAREGITVGAYARVQGALTSERKIEIRHDAAVLGPVVSEMIVLLGDGSCTGMPALPTTVSASRIFAEAGSAVFGTVVARDLGVVWSV
jgi:hypothetical protein